MSIEGPKAKNLSTEAQALTCLPLSETTQLTLAILHEGPTIGHQILKQIQENFRSRIDASTAPVDSNYYTSLSRMVRVGLIRRSETLSSSSGKQTIPYEITEVGSTALRMQQLRTRRITAFIENRVPETPQP